MLVNWRQIIVLGSFALGLGQVLVHAGDWPQILGKNRNAVAENEVLDAQWPTTGPRVIWSRPGLGSGFAGPAVADGRVFLFHRIDGQEVLQCLRVEDGEELWTTGFDSQYQPTYTSDDGPRCVPLVAGKRVIVFGAAGGLRALDRETGKLLWERETHKDFGAPEGYFGAGSTPLVEGDRVIVNVGGRSRGAGIVAFSITDGATEWKVSNELASYSSPIAVTSGGQRMIIVCARLTTLGLSPSDGRIIFELPFGQRGPTVNGATPVMLGDSLFLSASYGIGAVFGKLDSRGFEETWRSDSVLSSQYATAVEHQGLLIGVDGRQDFGPVELRCIDPRGPQVVSKLTGLEYGTIIKANDRLLHLDYVGQLSLIDIGNPREMRIVATAKVQKPTPRGYRLPALSNGQLFIRDDDTLRCVQVGKPASAQ